MTRIQNWIRISNQPDARSPSSKILPELDTYWGVRKYPSDFPKDVTAQSERTWHYCKFFEVQAFQNNNNRNNKPRTRRTVCLLWSSHRLGQKWSDFDVRWWFWKLRSRRIQPCIANGSKRNCRAESGGAILAVLCDRRPMISSLSPVSQNCTNSYVEEKSLDKLYWFLRM